MVDRGGVTLGNGSLGFFLSFFLGVKMMKKKEIAVKAVELSENSKIGPASTTYVSQMSCPSLCPLRGSGCYGEDFHVGAITRKLNETAQKYVLSPLQLARAEAREIDKLSGKRDLRVHTVGDCRTATSAKLVASAMRRYRKRGGRAAWTYTHAWLLVPRLAWGQESVLASCESTYEAKWAMTEGYAAALIVADFAQPSVYRADGLKILPCPAQVRDDVTCVSCRACFHADSLLRTNTVIAFRAHGSGRSKVLIQLGLKKPG